MLHDMTPAGTTAPAPPRARRRTKPAAPPNQAAADRLAAVVAEHGLPPQGTPVGEAFVIGLPGWPLAERVDGKLDYLPLPTPLHQTVSARLQEALLRHLWGRGIENAALRTSGLPVRIPEYDGNESRLRYPDLSLLRDENDPRAAADAWNGADLVVEIVSPDNPRRDTEEKRLDYAAAGVPEYWIADPRPRSRTITVLTLAGGAFAGEPRGEGEAAESVLLPGFAVDVAACLAGG